MFSRTVMFYDSSFRILHYLFLSLSFVSSSYTRFASSVASLFQEVSHNIMSGIWIVGGSHVQMAGTCVVSFNQHHGLRVGFAATYIGSSGTVVLSKGCRLVSIGNRRHNQLVEHGAVIVEENGDGLKQE